MFLKILDIHNEVTENVEFGTCELCFSTGDLNQQFFEVEIDGEIFDIEMGGWNWGDYFEDSMPEIDNIVKFNDFVMTQPIDLQKKGYNNTYVESEIHDELVALIEYYDIFHQKSLLKGDELLNSRLMNGVKYQLLTLSNYHNQDGGLQKIMTFLHNYEYYELNLFIYNFINIGYEEKIIESDKDQKFEYKRMLEYIDKYLALMK